MHTLSEIEPRPITKHRPTRTSGLDRVAIEPDFPPLEQPKPLLDYRLCVLTDGRPCLREALETFSWYVRPSPIEVVFFDDGSTQRAHEKVTRWNGVPWRHFGSLERLGFCEATAALWQLASLPGPEWIFWLEDDFRFTRRVDLGAIADVMDDNCEVAQMALYRNPVSDEELEHGGYLHLPGRPYEPRDTDGQPWIEHELYWTTNPSLFRREIAQANPWPRVPQCEGHFGFMLKDARPASTFGIWGDGTPSVRHVGIRSGHGY